ncbi:hypothetical protein [Methylomarinum vadi]|uniref:hypothetical protein n=1 Tax=Methylomarinum vadi TaxID=438855 RepID=UPI0004DF0568|nr:hypothetical protein [Methylomarinum vadi]
MSYEGRRSFLFGMTLNELAFMMFFLLMLLSTAALHDKSVELEQQKSKSNELERQIERTRQDLDASFKRLRLLEDMVGRITGLGRDASRELLEQAFAKLQAAGDLDRLAADNTRLRQELQELTQLRRQLQELQPDTAPEQTLQELIEQSRNAQREQQDLRGQLHFLQQQLKGNGLDHPPCWADPDNGAIQYLYRITIHEQTVTVEAAWPDSRAADASRLPGAAELAGQTLSLGAFQAKAAPIFQWSKSHECRHFVRIHDDPNTSKKAFKTTLLTIESVFYKYLEH